VATNVFYQERTYAFEVAEVEAASMNDLVLEFLPAGEGWEFYGKVTGHPNFNQRLLGNRQLVTLTYRKYGN
jgi:hypothetical protein